MENNDSGFFEGATGNSFETQMLESLLIEELTAKRAEVFENVVFYKKRRYYIEDLTERDYFLENTTPYQIKIGETVIEEHAWGAMLCAVTKYLLEKTPKSKEELFNFSCQWTKSKIFSSEKKTNHKMIDDDLYLNCNHTALHSCWVLQDILDLFSIEKSDVYFLIHRPCGAEPDNVKQYIEKRFKAGFFEYLMEKHLLSEKNAQRIIDAFKYLNKHLAIISKSYTNFFLFDDNAILQNYAKKVGDRIKKSSLTEQQKAYLIKVIALLVEYYRQ